MSTIARPSDLSATEHATDTDDASEASEPDAELAPISPDDAGEVLTIQRAAFVSEALIYGSADMPALTQTLEELEAELADAGGWVARVNGRLVGAIRTRQDDDLLLIGRIAIAPDIQGHGIGQRLLEAAEKHSSATEAELFTGSLSEANIALYKRCGYTETQRVDQSDGIEEVYMRKRLKN